MKSELIKIFQLIRLTANILQLHSMDVLKKKGCVWDDQKTSNGDPMNTTRQKATKKVNLDQVIKKEEEVEIFAEAQRKSNEGKTTQ